MNLGPMLGESMDVPGLLARVDGAQDAVPLVSHGSSLGISQSGKGSVAQRPAGVVDRF